MENVYFYGRGNPDLGVLLEYITENILCLKNVALGEKTLRKFLAPHPPISEFRDGVLLLGSAVHTVVATLGCSASDCI